MNTFYSESVEIKLKYMSTAVEFFLYEYPFKFVFINTTIVAIYNTRDSKNKVV